MSGLGRIIIDYFSHIFTNENKASRRTCSLPHVSKFRGSDSIIESKDGKMKSRECPQLRRYQSLSAIDQLELTNGGHVNRSRQNSFSKYTLPNSHQAEVVDGHRKLGKIMETSNSNEQENYLSEYSNDAWRSMDLGNSNYKNEICLKRVHSADSIITEIGDSSLGEEHRKRCDVINVCRENLKIIDTLKVEQNSGNTLNFHMDDEKPEYRNKSYLKPPQVLSAKENDSGVVCDVSSRTSSEDLFLTNVSLYFDAVPWFQRDSEHTYNKKLFETNAKTKQHPIEVIPEEYQEEFENERKASSVSASSLHFKQYLKGTILDEFGEEFESDRKAGSFSDQTITERFKSRIPICQSQKSQDKTKSNNRFRYDDRFGWTRSWKTEHARHPCLSIGIAQRSLVIINFEKKFREFTKKIYRRNVMDYVSHSKWMKKVGIFEEENAAGFKNYAKKKLVLTLPEYKDAIAIICKSYGLDYWDVLRRMADVSPGSDNYSFSDVSSD